MLPPLRSARAGPLKIGQVHCAAGNGAVPVAVLTAIVSPGRAVHVEAAQSAKSPTKIRKSCRKTWDDAGGAGSAMTAKRTHTIKVFRSMSGPPFPDIVSAVSNGTRAGWPSDDGESPRAYHRPGGEGRQG